MSEKYKWIYCSDELPKETGEYLVAYEWLNCTYVKIVNFEMMKTKTKWKTRENVFAWMPLIEPPLYK